MKIFMKLVYNTWQFSPTSSHHLPAIMELFREMIISMITVMHYKFQVNVPTTGADPGFEKGGGAGGSGASFWAYLGQFRPPPPTLDPRLHKQMLTPTPNFNCTSPPFFIKK